MNNQEIYNMMCEDKEIWKDIEGYDGKYQISQYGRVKSLKSGTPKILKVRKRIIKKHGGEYSRFIATLSKNSKMKDYKVHRLVAETFITKIEGYKLIDHIDGDSLNNRVNNLRWVNGFLNNLNSKRHKNNTTGHKGVIFCKDGRKKPWISFWYVNGMKNSKSFETKEAAIEHRKEMIEKHYPKEYYIENR